MATGEGGDGRAGRRRGGGGGDCYCSGVAGRGARRPGWPAPPWRGVGSRGAGANSSRPPPAGEEATGAAGSAEGIWQS